MSEQREPTGVPRVELRHRLGLALEYAKLSNEAMADHLGKSVTTIRNYLSGRTHPDRSTCRDWAMRCGVQLDWVLYGIEAEEPGDPGGQEISPRACNGGEVVDLRARRARPIPHGAAA